MFGHFPEQLLADFKEAYAEKLIRLPSGLYEIKQGKDQVSLVPAGIEPKAGA